MNGTLSQPLMDDLPWNLWYPLFQSKELLRRPRKFLRFGVDWVAFRRADGTPFMALDRCPHLGAALSAGTLDKDELVCPFHGFRYDREGTCTRAPMLGETASPPGRLTLRTIPLREVSGWVFGFWGDTQDPLPALPLFDALSENWPHGELLDEWPVHLTRAIENQLDAAHLPFVHRRTIGRGLKHALPDFKVEAQPSGLRIWTGHRRGARPPMQTSDAASLEFLYPGLWQLNIQDRLRLIVGFVPISDRRTRFQVRACHQIRTPVLGMLFSGLLSFSNRLILREDRRVVESVTPANSLEATDVLLAPDRAILEFRRQWRTLIARKPPCS